MNKKFSLKSVSDLLSDGQMKSVLGGSGSGSGGSEYLCGDDSWCLVRCNNGDLICCKPTGCCERACSGGYKSCAC